jgi:hypothetical protein
VKISFTPQAKKDLAAKTGIKRERDEVIRGYLKLQMRDGWDPDENVRLDDRFGGSQLDSHQSIEPKLAPKEEWFFCFASRYLALSPPKCYLDNTPLTSLESKLAGAWDISVKLL